MRREKPVRPFELEALLELVTAAVVGVVIGKMDELIASALDIRTWRRAIGRERFDIGKGGRNTPVSSFIESCGAMDVAKGEGDKRLTP